MSSTSLLFQLSVHSVRPYSTEVTKALSFSAPSAPLFLGVRKKSIIQRISHSYVVVLSYPPQLAITFNCVSVTTVGSCFLSDLADSADSLDKLGEAGVCGELQVC